MAIRQSRYSPALVTLHWLIFLLFVVALAAIEIRSFVPKGDPLRSTLALVHMTAGQLVLLLAVVRVYLRFTQPVPAALPGPTWQKLASGVLHLVLYAVMFALPLAGIIFVQAGGREISFFGLTLPHLIAANPDLRSPVKEVHELIGNAVYYLVGVHILAALWHQFVVKDGVLSRMRLR